VALFAFVGFTNAANVTIVKWDKDKDELTVKDDKDKEMTYKVTKETKVKNGDKEGDLEKTKARWEKAGDKLGDRKIKADITTDKDGKEITEIKLPEMKKK